MLADGTGMSDPSLVPDVIRLASHFLGSEQARSGPVPGHLRRVTGPLKVH